MDDLDRISDEYRTLADWLLITKLKVEAKDAKIEVPDSNTITLDWDLDNTQIRLDIRLNKKEGWLYISNQWLDMDSLRVFNLSQPASIDRMVACIEDYLK